MNCIWHYLKDECNTGSNKPYAICVFLHGIYIELEFCKEEFELFWDIHKLIDEEMKLNYRYSCNSLMNT